MTSQKQPNVPPIQLNEGDASLIETKELILSTKGSSTILLNGEKKSHALFNLRNIIDFENDKTIDYVSLSVPYAVVPNSMYNVNELTNRLDVVFSATTYTYTFPVGNYTYTSFMTAFTSVMPAHFSISFNSLTSKFTIQNTTYTFTLLESSTIDYIIGFSDTVSSTLIAPYKVVMPRCVIFLPTPIINVCCDEINNGQSLGKNSNPLFSNILCSIPNTSKLNFELVYQNVQDEFVMKSNASNTLTISILDDDGNYIDFNGVSSWFMLRFKIHKKYKTVKGSFGDFLTNATNIRKLFDEE
jgi:hypothetical protein